MKSLVNFIAESNENLSNAVDFNVFVEEIDKAFDEAKIKIVTSSAKQNEVYKYLSDSNYVTYTCILGKKEGKGNMDNGAKLGLVIDIASKKDGKLGVYVKFSWTNGKVSYSVFSKTPQNKRYELNLGKVDSHTFLQNWAGGHDYYECTPEIASCIVDGIKELKYEKLDFNDAMEKSRFTEAAWNKLCNKVDEIFKINNGGRKLKWNTYPWNA